MTDLIVSSDVFADMICDYPIFEQMVRFRLNRKVRIGLNFHIYLQPVADPSVPASQDSALYPTDKFSSSLS